MCGRNVCDKPLGAWVVVALGKGSSVAVRAGRGAAAALQTQQEAQSQTQNQRDHQVALTVRYLQREGSTVKEHRHIMSFIHKITKHGLNITSVGCCNSRLCIKDSPELENLENISLKVFQELL